MEENLTVENNEKVKPKGSKKAKIGGIVCLALAVVVWLIKSALPFFAVFINIKNDAVIMESNTMGTINLVLNIVMLLLIVVGIVFFAYNPKAIQKREGGEAYSDSKRDFIIDGIIALMGFIIAAVLVLVAKVGFVGDVVGDILFLGIPIGGLIYIIKSQIIVVLPSIISTGASFVHNFACFFFAVPFVGIFVGALAWLFFMGVYVGVCIGAILGLAYSFAFVLLLRIISFVLCLLGVQVSRDVMKKIELVGIIVSAVVLGFVMFFVFAGALL